jgi:Fic family protein
LRIRSPVEADLRRVADEKLHRILVIENHLGFEPVPTFLSQWAGVYPPVEARAAQPRRGEGCHAALFDLLRDEPDPAVRVVLRHFVFVYIHPYMDGNGRIDRFLMNLMMAAGGYPWTVIPVTARKAYMEALENVSVGEDIGPFTEFLAGLVEKRLTGEPLPEVPKI